MHRLCLAMITVVLLASCTKATTPPKPITDGITCSVTAKGETKTERLSVTRSGECYDAYFMHTDGTKGLGMSISPSGCYLSFYKVKKQIDMQYISTSLPALIYTALNHDYTADSYSDGVYTSSDTCGKFQVWVGEDGLISKIDFISYKYICQFDYKTA